MSNQILDISHWFFTKREKLIFGPGNREVDKTAWKKSNAAFGLSGPKFYTNKRLYFMTVLAIDLCYHGDMTMSVSERGNSQVSAKKRIYPLRELGKTTSRGIYFFHINITRNFKSQSYSNKLKPCNKHDLYENTMINRTKGDLFMRSFLFNIQAAQALCHKALKKRLQNRTSAYWLSPQRFNSHLRFFLKRLRTIGSI